MYRMTIDIFCDCCSMWIGDGCETKDEIVQFATEKGWLIKHHGKLTHLCPVCKEKPCAD